MSDKTDLNVLPRLWLEHGLHLYKPGHCLNAGRVALEICGNLGYDARPCYGRVTFYNRKAWRMMREGKDISEWPPSAWSVGVPVEPSGPGILGGHVWVMANDTLVDLSAAELSRPEHGIDIPPLILPLEDLDEVVKLNEDDYGAVWKRGKAVIVYDEREDQIAPWDRDPVPSGWSLKSNLEAINAIMEVMQYGHGISV